jgi:hypothetical protein
MSTQILENVIYKSIIGHCEELESDRRYIGNGHHLAQELTKLVSIGLLPKEKRKIYDALTSKPQLTKEIAAKVDMPSKTVSAQLQQMYSTTLLVHFKVKNERRKMWYK